jgi:hypothetical protein
MSVAMEPETVTRQERRAWRLLRWYPREWRDRYGEEFAALLVDEMGERPRSVRRSLNVTWSGLVARTSQAGMAGAPLGASAQSRASLGWLTAALAAFLCFGLGMWAQLVVGWQWTSPDTAATTVGTVVITLSVLYLAVMGVAALVPVVALAILQLARRWDPVLMVALTVTAVSGAVLIAGARHFENGWPGTGGHRWAGQGMVPGGIAAFVWAATLSVTSYWAHPGALGSFPTSELVWMAASPIAMVGLAGGATATFRRLELPKPVARFELRCGQAALVGMAAFLLGAIAWLTDTARRPPSIPSNLFHVGVIDVIGAFAMAGSLLVARVAVRRGLAALRSS